MRFRRDNYSVFLAIVVMLVLVFAAASSGWAQRQVLASQLIKGPQTVKGGLFSVQTAAGASVFTIAPATGATYVKGLLSLDGGATALGVPTVTTAAGKALGIASGAGNGGTTTGYAGGAFSLASGAGSAGTTTGGAGGALSVTGGTGGTTATGTGGAGAAIALTSGTGGAASGAGTGGAGGALTIASGDGGATTGGTGGAGGALNIYTGNAAGSAADGSLTVKVGGASGTTVLTADSSGLATPIQATVSETTATRVCTSADYGKTVFLSYAGAVAVTLPANGAPAGATIRFIVVGDNNCAPTISTATADTLITFNDAAADSITYGTGHRIGACVLLISNGTYWVALNQSANNTMTINT